MKKSFTFLLLVLAVSQGYSQIMNPSLNDAFLLPKGGFSITAGYSSLGVGYDGDTEGFLNSLDFQIGFGISQKVNLNMRYQKAWYAQEMFDEPIEDYLFIGPEIQLKENRISFFLPIGTSLSKDDGDNRFELTPTFNFSLPLGQKVFFTPALELGFMFCEGCSDKPFLGIDLGLAIRPTDRITIFGEYDLVYSFEEFGDGHIYMISGGIAFQMYRKEKIKD